MEESEKRRERLKAMRMEAACSENSNNVLSPMPSNLSNPLVETSEAMHDGSCAASRFGFYTDPMAAFSTDRKRNNAVNNQISADYFTSPIDGSSSRMRFSSPLPGIFLY